MKKQSQDQTNEQLHIDDAAAAQEEYSFEEIMNEFGGWTRREEPAPQPEPETHGPAASVNGPDEPKQQAASAGDTIRFTPVQQPQAEPEQPAVWVYQGEPDPEQPPRQDPKEARAQARAERREKRQADKRRRQLERYQKAQAAAADGAISV